MASTFAAGGLASGLDSNTIIDTLVKLESRPIELLQARQTGLKTQISVLGDLASKLSSLQTAAKALGDSGALGVKVNSTHTDFTAAPSATSAAGRFQVQVTSVAATAKQRSTAFASATAPVTGGNLHIDSMGQGFDIAISDGESLSDVAFAINQSGASVTAAVLTNGTGSYLSITNRDSGHPVGSAPSSALSITHTPTGSAGQALTFGTVATASNAVIQVDGLSFESTTSAVSGAIPGTVLTANTVGAAQELVLGADGDGTQKNLQKFVDAYNDVAKVVQKQLNVTDTTNRGATLAGDSALRSLQQKLQRLVSTSVGSGTVRALADLGVKSARDGSLSIDRSTLDKAIAKDPVAVNDIFAHASTGLSATTKSLVDGYTNTVDGLLVTRKANLSKTVSKMDDDMDALQTRLDAFRENLVRQYTAMEKVVSGLKSIGNYLTSQEAQSTKGS